MNPYPTTVKAITQIIADDAIFAEPGEIGRVLDQARADDSDDSDLALLVLFPNAPAATTCYLGDMVVPFLSVVR